MERTIRKGKRKSLAIKRVTKVEQEIRRAIYGPCDHWRPKIRADCDNVERPCPYVGCKYNLYLDVNEKTGSIKFNFPDKEPHQMEHSCVLDLAERTDMTLEEIGDLMNLTRERIRQYELMCFDIMKIEFERRGISVNSDEWIDDSGEKAA
jgi:hypothetical protein